jgi:hypothetical protein
MSSLSPKDRVSLCLFSYEDGRRCRTPRISSHPHFCFYHAKKESQSQSTEKLAKDLAYFFSGDYLSANDLNTALGRLIPAVIRAEIKPRAARTVAYMLQTLVQSTRLAQHEYINAFGTDGWRDAVCTSVNNNHDYLYPPGPNDPEPEDESEVDSKDDSADAPEPQPPTQAPPPQPSPCPRPSPADTEAALAAARSLFPPRTNSAPPQSASPQSTPPQSPAPTPQTCHPERSEGPCLDPTSPTIDETQLPSAAAPLLQPTTNPTPTQTAQPNNAPPAAPPPPHPRRQPGAPTREPYAVHFDHNYRLFVDGKPW